MNEPAVIACAALKKSFWQGDVEVPVLNSVDLQVGRGERIAIVGSSGSGKSTLLHLLGGLDKPSSGSVSILGRELTALSDAERGHMRNASLGFVYQFHSIKWSRFDAKHIYVQNPSFARNRLDSSWVGGYV